MVAAIYFRADAVLLSVMKGSEAVGIYGVAYRLLEAIVAFPGFFYVSIFPLLSQGAARGDLANVREVTQRAFDLLVLSAVPLVAGTIVAAPEIVHALAGAEFADAVTPLRIVIVGAGLMFLSGLLSYVLIAVGRQSRLLWVGARDLDAQRRPEPRPDPALQLHRRGLGRHGVGGARTGLPARARLARDSLRPGAAGDDEGASSRAARWWPRSSSCPRTWRC